MTLEGAEARGHLLFHLENQTGFWLGVVVGDDARPRARLREEAEAWCKEHGMAFHVHAPAPEGLARLAVELARGAPSGLHWIRTDGPARLIDQWETATLHLLTAMNERREAYRKRLDGGVVLDGRASLKRHLRDMAPDLFSIRAFIAEPGVGEGTVVGEVPEWRASVPSMAVALSAVCVDPDREIERAERLRGIEGAEAQRGWLEGMQKAALGLLFAGRFEEAEKRFTQVIDHWSRADRVEGLLVRTRGLRAFATRARGRFEDWLVHLDAMTALAETQLRDAQGVAQMLLLVELGQLHQGRGDLLFARGDLVAAEQSYRRRVDAAEALVKLNPLNQEWQLDLSSARQGLAKVLLRKGDLTAAEEVLREAISYVEQVVSAHPRDDGWQLQLLKCSLALGDVLGARGDLAAALEQFRTGLRAAEGLAERETDDRWQKTKWIAQWMVYLTEGSFLMAQGEFDAAMASVAEAIGVAELLYGRARGDLAIGWISAISHAQRAQILQKQGNLEGAAETLLSAWNRARDLPVDASSAPMAYAIANLHRDLGNDLFGEAQARDEGGPSVIAKRFAGFQKRAVRLSERALRVLPQEPVIRELLETDYNLLAALLDVQGKRRAARRLRRKRRALHRRRPPRQP